MSWICLPLFRPSICQPHRRYASRARLRIKEKIHITSHTPSTSNMEFSSPLAAMHPPALLTWGARRDVPASRFTCSGSSSTFNFRDLSMQRSQSHDYFSMKPPRGSSPTASLAADLSSNFHIDQRYTKHSAGSASNLANGLASPQIPTPRRSLFARDMFLPCENKGTMIQSFVCLQSADPVERTAARHSSRRLRRSYHPANSFLFSWPHGHLSASS